MDGDHESLVPATGLDRVDHLPGFGQQRLAREQLGPGEGHEADADLLGQGVDLDEFADVELDPRGGPVAEMKLRVLASVSSVKRSEAFATAPAARL